MYRMRPPSVCNGWDRVPGHSSPFAGLVSPRLVGYHSEEWSERAGAQACYRGELQDRVDVPPQAQTGDGSPRKRDAGRTR